MVRDIAIGKSKSDDFRKTDASGRVSRFILGDCVRVMATIPDNAIDFILTDPPYLVGFRDRSGRTPLPVTLTMTGCNLPVMRCTAY